MPLVTARTRLECRRAWPSIGQRNYGPGEGGSSTTGKPRARAYPRVTIAEGSSPDGCVTPDGRLIDDVLCPPGWNVKCRRCYFFAELSMEGRHVAISPWPAASAAFCPALIVIRRPGSLSIIRSTSGSLLASWYRSRPQVGMRLLMAVIRGAHLGVADDSPGRLITLICLATSVSTQAPSDGALLTEQLASLSCMTFLFEEMPSSGLPDYPCAHCLSGCNRCG